MYSSHSRPRGFTLVELLVVIAIVAILAAILFPTFTSCRLDARNARCGSNLKQLSSALLMYSSDYDNRFPPHAYPSGSRSVTLPYLIHPYLKDQAVWSCPPARNQRTPAIDYDGTPDDTTVSYGYNWTALTRNGVGIRQEAVSQPAETVCFVDSTTYLAAPAPLVPAFGGSPASYRHTKRVYTAWTDGHVKLERPGKLEAVVDQEGGKPTGNGIDRYQYWNLR